jgi:chaperonin GroES
MKLIPLYQKVIVRPLVEPDRTKGGIIVPETARKTERAYTAKVVAVGPGRILQDGQLLPCTVKVGDTVICPHYVYRDNNGTEQTSDIEIKGPEGEMLRVVLEPDLHAIVEE